MPVRYGSTRRGERERESGPPLSRVAEGALPAPVAAFWRMPLRISGERALRDAAQWWGVPALEYIAARAYTARHARNHRRVRRTLGKGPPGRRGGAGCAIAAVRGGGPARGPRAARAGAAAVPRFRGPGPVGPPQPAHRLAQPELRRLQPAAPRRPGPDDGAAQGRAALAAAQAAGAAELRRHRGPVAAAAACVPLHR